MSRIKDLQRQTGFNQSTVRSPEDFYITPEFAVKELLRWEVFEGVGWEPASGGGAISRFFPGIMASDIRTEGVEGEGGVDFLQVTRICDFVVTNPPFRLMLEFAQHGLECASKVVLLGRIQFLEGVKRYEFFKVNPPRRIYVFSSRLTCLPSPQVRGEGGGGGLMCFAWFVWERGFHGTPELHWIQPEKYGEKQTT